MSRNISEICLEIGKTVKRLGASAEASIKVDELLVEIVEAKNEVYLQGRTDQKHEDEDIMIVLTKHEIEAITKPLKDMITSLCAALNSTSGCECCPYFYKAECLYNNGIDAWLVGDESNMHINKELAQKYSSQLKPVDDIAAVLKQPMQLAGHTQINKASNSIDIALGANVKVPGGFTLVVKEYGVEVQGVTNWNNQKESQDASDMAGALATLLRNASGQLQHVGTDSRQITQWNEDVEKVLGYFGIDTSKDFTVNGVKYTREGSAIHKAIA